MRKSYFLMFKSWLHHHFFFTWCTPRFQCWSCIILWFPVQLSTLYRRLQHVFSERVSLSLSHLAGLKISPDATILMRMLTSMFYNAYILRQWMNPKEISSVSTKPDILPPSSKTQQCIVKQEICILRKKKIIQWMCCTLTNVSKRPKLLAEICLSLSLPWQIYLIDRIILVGRLLHSDDVCVNYYVFVLLHQCSTNRCIKYTKSQDTQVVSGNVIEEVNSLTDYKKYSHFLLDRLL